MRDGGRPDRYRDDRAPRHRDAEDSGVGPGRHADEPQLPESVKPNDLDKAARNELRTLSKENADAVARHLVMAGRLVEDDPEEAHRHALAAGRRAGRVAVVRESLAITAYATGDFALALRELRTFRRISGSDDQIGLMVDSERGVGRPDRALELGRSVDRSVLPLEAQVALAIAMSGARLDLSDAQGALDELEQAPVDLQRVHPWSSTLFESLAAVHEDLGDAEASALWRRRAERAEALLDEVGEESTTVEVDTEYSAVEPDPSEPADDAEDDDPVDVSVDDHPVDVEDSGDDHPVDVGDSEDEDLVAVEAEDDQESSVTGDDQAEVEETDGAVLDDAAEQAAPASASAGPQETESESESPSDAAAEPAAATESDPDPEPDAPTAAEPDAGSRTGGTASRRAEAGE